MNRLLIIYLAGLVAVCQADLIPSQELASILSTYRVDSAFPEGQCKPGVSSVCKTCTSVKFCIGGENAPVVDCKDNTPFCKDGICSAEPNPHNSCSTNFKCTGEGYMPDPSNCTKFHYCPKLDGTATSYECPKGFVYNYPSLMCKPKKSESDCVTIKCTPDKYFVTYPPNKSFYAFCVQNQPPAMYRCNDPDYEKFDESKFGCVWTCPTEGVHPHPDNKKYNVCYNLGASTLMTKEYDCPPDMKFNTEVLKCLKNGVTPGGTR